METIQHELPRSSQCVHCLTWANRIKARLAEQGIETSSSFVELLTGRGAIQIEAECPTSVLYAAFRETFGDAAVFFVAHRCKTVPAEVDYGLPLHFCALLEYQSDTDDLHLFSNDFMRSVRKQ